MPSAVPTAIDLLLPALQAAVAAVPVDADVIPVSDGDPQTLNREHVVIVGTSTWTQDLADFESDHDEAFVIDGIVHVGSPGASLKDSRDRAFVILAAIEAAIKATPDLTGTNTTADFKPQSYAPYPSDEGHDVQLRFGIEVRAYI